MTTYGVLSYIEAKANKTLEKGSSSSNVNLLKEEPIPFRDPKVIHRVIDETECAGKEVFIIGDVHGCLVELKELLAKCDLLKGDRVRDDAIVILCGDLVTKGPDNIETLHFIKNAGILAIRGNQDDKCILRYLRHKRGNEYRKKNQWMVNITNEELDLILELPYSISIPCIKTVVVHAGLLPGVPIEEQNRFVLTYMRGLTKENGAFKPCINQRDGQLWAKYWQGPYHVFFGHDAMNGLQQYEFATGLDTGCVYGNCLTGKFVMGRRKGEFVSVKAKKVYQRTHVEHEEGI